MMPGVTGMFTDGRERFFNKGEIGRWKGVFREEDLALYAAKLRSSLEPACVDWLAGERATTGDPAKL